MARELRGLSMDADDYNARQMLGHYVLWVVAQRPQETGSLTKTLRLQKGLQTQMVEFQRLAWNPQKGTEGVVGLTQWFEKIDPVYSSTKQLVQYCHVKFAYVKPLQEMLLQGHFKKDCPKLKNNNNRGNQVGNAKAQAKVYAMGNAGANPNNNVVTGTLKNTLADLEIGLRRKNCYAPNTPSVNSGFPGLASPKTPTEIVHFWALPAIIEIHTKGFQIASPMTKQPRKVPSFDWGDINKKRFSNVEAEALFSASNPGLHLRKQDIIAYCEGFQQRRVFGRCVDAKRKCDSYASRQLNS
ncbi:hypothetical protein Tco_0791859 [Tanacetum coccineum]